MASFIHVGDKVINLDYVDFVDLDAKVRAPKGRNTGEPESGVKIYLFTGTEDSASYAFTGEAAQSLREFFRTATGGLMAGHFRDPDAQEVA